MVVKKQSAKKTVVRKKTTSPVEIRLTKRRSPIAMIRSSIDDLLLRRPHRSFRRTRRRDYDRSLELPGYIAFTYEVQKLLWRNRKLFLGLIIVYGVISGLMVGIASQDTYNTLTSTLKSTSGSLFNGGLGAIGQASLLFATTITGSLSQNLTQVQQVYAGILALMAWLTTVWLLRNILAGHKVKLRDGLYSSASPILPTFMVALLLLVQLIPIAIAVIGYGAASQTGLLNGGIEAFLFWFAAGMLTILSLYWMTTTIFALIVVTLPGMYPWRAIRTAGDLVVGRRVRILARFLWMILCIIVFWAVVMIPVILVDAWVKSLWPATSGVPTVPIVLLAISSLTIVWVSTYIYLLYRKVVADDASPA
jgi:hypothetical protein